LSVQKFRFFPLLNKEGVFEFRKSGKTPKGNRSEEEKNGPAGGRYLEIVYI
jgi:hypothetical protein